MKINIIVAKKYRDRQYQTFLYYLNQISKDHDVSVYISSCGDDIAYCNAYLVEFENMRTDHEYVNIPVFNKSILLNHGLKRMRKNYDIVSIFDVDMIYHYDFFDIIEHCFSIGIDYTVTYGKQLSPAMSEKVYLFPEINEIFKYVGKEYLGCSQITMNKKVIFILENLFGKVFDERYEGWGGEDSDISFKSKMLTKLNIIQKKELYNCWVHLWHESNKPVDHINSNNYKIFHDSKIKIENKIKEYEKVS